MFDYDHVLAAVTLAGCVSLFLRRTAIDYNTKLYKNSTHTFMALQRERVHNLACMMGTGANLRGASVAGALGLAHTMGLGRAFWVAEKTVCFIVGISRKVTVTASRALK